MTPLDKALARAGYTRTDTAQAVEIVEPVDPAAETPTQTVYPQVVMVQGRSASESWIREHAGQLLVAAGVGVFALSALVVVALVAVAVMLAAITGTVGLVAIKAMTANTTQPRRGRRGR